MTRKRIRSTLVCVNCRKKKMKCDRNLPCSSCVNAGIDLTCTYSSATYKRPQFEKAQPSTVSNQSSFKNSEEENILVSRDFSMNERLVSLKHKVKELETSIAIENLNRIQPLLPGNNESSNSHWKNIQEPINEPTQMSRESNSYLTDLNPIASEEDTISFLSSFKQPSRDKSKNISYPYRPLQFIFLLKRDAGAKLFFDYQMSLKNFSWKQKNLKLSSTKNGNIASSEQELSKNDEFASLDQKSRTFYGSSYIKKIAQNYTYSDTIEIKRSISAFGINLGLTFCSSEIREDLKLFDKIKLVLPTQKVISSLLKVFFESLYPFFPIVDEISFMSDISKILGIDIKAHEKPINVVIDKKRDLATLCVLLIILRMSYLSIFSNVVNQNDDILNTPEEENQETKFLMMNPVSLDTIGVAESCLKEFDLTTNQDLIVLQAATFVKIYRGYAPEEGSGYADSELLVFIGILIHMANSLYLNRDPDYFLDCETDERTKHLQRKLWLFLVNQDVEDSITFGTPILTIDENFDTKLPFYCQNNSNLLDVDFESQVIKAFEYLNPVFKCIHNILEITLKVKSAPKMSYLAKSLTELENLIDTNLGQFKDLFVPDDSLPEFLKIMKLKLFLYCKLFLSYTYYCIHVYYEEKGLFHLHLFYLKKLIMIIFHDFAGISGALLHNYREYFGSTFTLIMTPILEVLCRMEIVISLIIFIRLQSTIKCISSGLPETSPTKKNNPDQIILSLKKLSSLLRTLADKSIETVSIMGSRYYFAWRSKKAYRYIMKLLLENSIYDNNEQDTRKASLKFSINELDSMIKLLKSSVNVKNSEFRKYFEYCDRTADIDTRKESKSEYLMNENQLENLWTHLGTFKRDNKELNSNKNSNFTENGNPNFNTEYDNDIMRDFEFLSGFSFNEPISYDDLTFDLFATGNSF